MKNWRGKMKLRANNLTMRYENGPKVLDDISFEIDSGEVFALVGRNGSGKTTILQILSQILDPINGELFLDDKDISINPNLKENIAYLPDNFDFFSYDSAKSAMDYYSTVYREFDKDFVKGEADKLSIDLSKSIRNQSKGNKTLLGLIIVLATKAPIILLDEVLDGIDVLNKSKIIDYILDAKEEGRAILVSSHQLAELQGIADKVFYLSLDGKISKSEGDTSSQVQKFQIVTSSEIPPSILDHMLVRQHIGRVYTVLIDKDIDIQELLSDSTVVQYDELPVLLEDLFYWEDRHEQHTKTN